MVSVVLQVPLDGMHVKVDVRHRWQGGCHEAQQVQEEESWFVPPYSGGGSDTGKEPVYPILEQVQSAQVGVRHDFFRFTMSHEPCSSEHLKSQLD